MTTSSNYQNTKSSGKSIPSIRLKQAIQMLFEYATEHLSHQVTLETQAGFGHVTGVEPNGASNEATLSGESKSSSHTLASKTPSSS